MPRQKRAFSSKSRHFSPLLESIAYIALMKKERALIWLRRDLRLEDHALLASAESDRLECVLAFIFDEKILGILGKNDRRIGFFHSALEEISEELEQRGSRLVVRVGNPVKEIPRLAKMLGVSVVLAGRDYESYSQKRDKEVAKELGPIRFESKKDQVIFEGGEILNGSGGPYKVFTAYKNAWLKQLKVGDYDKKGTRMPKLLPASELGSISSHRWDLKTLGFAKQPLWLEPGEKAAKKRLSSFSKKISNYKKTRDFPTAEGTSGLSAHLRFGTISIRACLREALLHKGEGSATWISELIWRDFYHTVLDQFPQVARGEAFRSEYNKLDWPGTEQHFLPGAKDAPVTH